MPAPPATSVQNGRKNSDNMEVICQNWACFGDLRLTNRFPMNQFRDFEISRSERVTMGDKKSERSLENWGIKRSCLVGLKIEV